MANTNGDRSDRLSTRSFLDFQEACTYLSLAPDQFVELRTAGFVIPSQERSRQEYPIPMLDLARILIDLAAEHQWSLQTVALLADLTFASEVGQSILLNLLDKDRIEATVRPKCWIETEHVIQVSKDLTSRKSPANESAINLLRSLTFIGEGQFWANLEELQNSSLFPLIDYFERQSIGILDQHHVIARDASTLVMGLSHIFSIFGSPISIEFNNILSVIRDRLKSHLEARRSIDPKEQVKIAGESLVAVDKLYATNSVEIHTPPQIWDVKFGILSAKKTSLTLRMKLPEGATETMIDNVIDLVRPFVGNFGARVIHLLYEVANDAPNWRNPTITVNTNDLLDRLGVKRNTAGFHEARNRQRLRDVFNVAHELEIVGAYSTYENGEPVRKEFYKTVLSLISATFSAKEHENIAEGELRKKGLPKIVTIKLNFYDGVRRPDGKLGSQYVLMPRLPSPSLLIKANHAGASETLKAYLLLRYRQTRMVSRTLTLRRGTTLEKAGITNKNASRATMTLRKALDRLVKQGVIESYSTVLPTQPQDILKVTLSEQAVYVPSN